MVFLFIITFTAHFLFSLLAMLLVYELVKKMDLQLRIDNTFNVSGLNILRMVKYGSPVLSMIMYKYTVTMMLSYSMELVLALMFVSGVCGVLQTYSGSIAALYSYKMYPDKSAFYTRHYHMWVFSHRVWLGLTFIFLFTLVLHMSFMLSGMGFMWGMLGT